jgi:hypothetical protein
MTTLALPASAVKPTRSASSPAALDGPAWADDDRCEPGPDAADDRWHAEQSANHHFTGPTPVEALDAPEPDWDALAEEAAALDRLCAGCLL